MADNVSIDTGFGPAANRRIIATDETANVHTLKVTDTVALAQLVANNTDVTAELCRMIGILTDEVFVSVKQILAQLELVTGTVFTPEDVED